MTYISGNLRLIQARGHGLDLGQNSCAFDGMKIMIIADQHKISSK